MGAVAAIVMPRLPPGWPQVAALTVLFCVDGVFFPVATTLIAEVSPVWQRGAAVGVSSALATSAGVIAPSVMGVLVSSGATDLSGFHHGWTICGLVSLIGGIAVFGADPDRTGHD